MHLNFSDIFEVSTKALDRYGAFNISLVADLPCSEGCRTSRNECEQETGKGGDGNKP